jgi:Sel1 repeat
MKRTTLVISSLFLLIDAAIAAQPVSDLDLAAHYFQAAQAGDDNAQFYLAALYATGVGEPRSDEEAFRWLSRATDQGHTHAMLILSGLYAIGRGVKQDNIQAYKWAYVVNVGSKIDEFRNDSRQLIGRLEAKMTSAEISQAKAEAFKYHAVSAKDPAKPAPVEKAPTRPAVADSAPAPGSIPAPLPAPAKANDNPSEFGRNAKRP